MTNPEPAVVGSTASEEDIPVLLKAVRDLAPRIAAAADDIERERRLPAALVQALADANLFRMLVPSHLGGEELDLATSSMTSAKVAKADASTAWCLGQGATYGLEAVRFDPETARRIWDDPRGVVAVGPGSGTAHVVEGGYRLSGQWRFASGGHHATWLAARGVPVHEADGNPLLGADGRPELGTFHFPAAAAMFTDVWHVSGLRGTGSDSYAVTDLFVPRSDVLASVRADSGEHGPLYSFPTVSVFGAAFASVALGLARASMDSFIVLAQTKRPVFGATLLRDDPVVQHQLGHAKAELRSAHAFLHLAIANAWRSACQRRSLPMDERVLLRLAITHAIHSGAHVVDVVYHAAGATAIFTSDAFERRFRDVHAITQQAQGADASFGTAGGFLLGADISRLGWTL
jgi:alkylation response protein AidB-like acyl-CoA dehydrogenase